MQRWPDHASDNSVNYPEMRVKVLDQRAAVCCSADKMRWCEAALREWKREDVVQLNHSRVFRWLIESVSLCGFIYSSNQHYIQ